MTTPRRARQPCSESCMPGAARAPKVRACRAGRGANRDWSALMFISPIGTGVPGPIRPLTAAPPMPALTDERACRNVLTWLRELDSHRYFHPSYYAGREIV